MPCQSQPGKVLFNTGQARLERSRAGRSSAGPADGTGGAGSRGGRGQPSQTPSRMRPRPASSFASRQAWMRRGRIRKYW
jgi:hypothetical protein